MADCLFIKAPEVVKMLGVSQSEAYRIIKKLNEENTIVSVVSPLGSVSLPKNTSISTKQLQCRGLPSKNIATAVALAEIL